MSRLRWAGRFAVAGTTLLAASGLTMTTAAADHSSSTASWSTATTNYTWVTDFDTGTVNLPAAVSNANRLQIFTTTGYGHSHGGSVTLSVNLLPSGTTVWSRTLADDEEAPMSIDIRFPAVASVTGVQITSSPFQSQTYHGFSGTDLITVSHSLPQCSDGVDNDGDGLADYPADPGCASPLDDSEGVSCTTASSVTACAGVSTGSEIQRVSVRQQSVVNGPQDAIAGYLDVYRFILPGGTAVNVPCVVLTRPGSANLCAGAGGTFVSRAATLAEVAEPAVVPGAELATVGICNAELVATVNDIGVSSSPIYSLC